MPAAHVNGLMVEYDVHGDDGAPPLLLVMGLGGQLIGWSMEFVDRLVARGFRVIRFDNRDAGLSTKIDAPAPTRAQLVRAMVTRRVPDPPYLLADMAQDTVGLLDSLGIEQAHVVGISMGGMIAQTLAIHHPDRVASLTSIMSNTGDRRHGRPRRALMRKMSLAFDRDPVHAVDNGVEMFRLISGSDFDPVETRELVEEAHRRCPDTSGTARQSLAVIASPDRTWDLRRVTAPTLVVHGLVDPLVQPSGGIATARAIRGSRLVMYPEMGHDVPKRRWDELMDEIVANTRRAEGGSAGQPAKIA